MTTPRPHPRFAGAEVLIIHGANMVHEGASKKNVGLIVGGVVLVVVGVAIAALGYYYRDVLARWLRRAQATARAAGGDDVAPPPPGPLEMVRLPAAVIESGNPPVAASPLGRRVDHRVNVDVEPARLSANRPAPFKTYL